MFRCTIYSRHYFAVILRAFTFCLAIIAGVCFGVQCFFSQQEIIIAILQRSLICSVSITGIFGVFALLIITFAVHAIYNRSAVFCIAVFIESFCYIVAVLGCYFAFAGCGWFVNLFLLFPAHVSVGSLVLFSVIYYIRQERLRTSHAYTAAVLIVTTTILNCYCFQPYLISVFSR